MKYHTKGQCFGRQDNLVTVKNNVRVRETRETIAGDAYLTVKE
jgi:hypothetical protein